MIDIALQVKEMAGGFEVSCKELDILVRAKTLAEAIDSARRQRKATLLRLAHEDDPGVEDAMLAELDAMPFKDEQLGDEWRLIPFASNFEISRSGEVRKVCTTDKRRDVKIRMTKCGYVLIRTSADLLREVVWGRSQPV